MIGPPHQTDTQGQLWQTLKRLPGLLDHLSRMLKRNGPILNIESKLLTKNAAPRHTPPYLKYLRPNPENTAMPMWTYLTLPDSKVLEPPPFDKLTIGRSYVTSVPAGGPENFCKQNIQNDVIAHEYAHIIGLVDEYRDDGLNMAGCVYEMPGGKNIEALPNADTVARRETVVGGRFTNEREILNSVARRGAMPRHPRYCLTVAMNVKNILDQNGDHVRYMEIL